jgi:capsular exopolysaccharide synthesis family protein
MNIVSPDLRTSVALDAAPASRPREVERIPVIRQYFRIALRWRYIILGTTGACLLLGLIVTLLMVPKYTAVVTVEISRESDKVTDFQGVERETSVADQEFYQTQYGLLRSRSLAERVAAQLRLIDDPKFFELFRVSSKSPALQQVNGKFPAFGRAERQRAAGEALLDHVAITPTRLSRLVDIGFISPEANLSAKIANAWAENFIQINLERKVQATSYGRNLLQGQLAQLKDRLDQSQRQLVAYASEQRIINLPTQTSGDNKTTSERSIETDNLAALNTALTQATLNRIEAEARFQQTGRDGASTEALRNEAINALRQKRAELAADYQRIMTQFEPEYPAAKAIKSQVDQLDRSIAREVNRVTDSLQGDYREARKREQDLRTKVDELKSSYLDLRRRSIQYNIYQQEVDTNRALYDGVLQRFKEIGVAGGVGVNNISIVDPADIPQKPSSPKLLLNLAIALLAGLGLGGLVAFALEQMDEAISDPAELERRIGLTLLGSIPKTRDGVIPRDELIDRKSHFVDAYMAVQANLSFTTDHGVPRSFAVTSTRPAEGKSTTAMALAVTLTRAERKVILIDGDMRSPSVHHLGGVSNDRGLSNFLTGEDDLESLTFKMKDFGFTAMAAGPIPPNAAELLTGSRLSLLIARLLQTYDHVVIDSPPVMGLADAPLIASCVEGVIYAVESHGIRSSIVKSALDRLVSANSRIFGAVLTKFEAQRAHYGYGYEYGYGYGRSESKA